MNIGRIVHQQVFQLKWHVLACFGLLMALPLEEAVMNAWEGRGFYAGSLTLAFPVMAAPLLAGLIACANVQADLDDRRYIFWRSKPTGVKSFMTIKFIIGLLITVVIIACPIIFAYATSAIVQDEKIERDLIRLVMNFQVISLLAYSVCYFCNVLIRKTARAWLVGMALTAFLLLLPFLLPLNVKTIADIFEYLYRTSTLTLLLLAWLIALAPAAAAFVLSLMAAARNWHLKTNLKGLLWTAAAAVLLLAFFFAHQVANIKVLDEQPVKRLWWFSLFHCIDDKIVTQVGFELKSHDGRFELIEFIPMLPSEYFRAPGEDLPPLNDAPEGLELRVFPLYTFFYHKINGQLYAFRLVAYGQKAREEDERGNSQNYFFFKHVYMRSFRVEEGKLISASDIDLSDCLKHKQHSLGQMRIIGDKIVAFVDDQCVTIAVADGGAMEIISRELFGQHPNFLPDREHVCKLPLVPAPAVDMQDRIRLSIDYIYRKLRCENYVNDSLVDIHNGTISFYVLNDADIARYDIVRWDKEYVYCKFQYSRPFVFLEQMFNQVGSHDRYFVRNGKFYAYEARKLMVFDIRNDRIRKLGHFERLSNNFWIYDVGVLEDGNIAIITNIEGNNKTALYLLKNPE
jgi:hypothetical protein